VDDLLSKFSEPEFDIYLNKYIDQYSFILFPRMGYLDKWLDGFQQLIDDKFTAETPVIFLMDNINMYRGKARHDRLVRKLGPKMWNFTARAALLPCLDGMEHLFLDSTHWMKPQNPVEHLKAKDILLGTVAAHFIRLLNCLSGLICTVSI
jgi:hypothetical protein